MATSHKFKTGGPLFKSQKIKTGGPLYLGKNGRGKKNKKGRSKKKDENIVRGKEVTIRDSAAPAQVIYGRMRVGGVTTMIHTDQNSAAYLETGVEADNNMLLWTAKAGGDAGNNITLEIVSIGASNPTTTCTCTVGGNIKITLATNASNVSTSTLDQVKVAVEGQVTANGFVKIAKRFAGTNGKVQVQGVTSFSYGGGGRLHQIITLAGHEIDYVAKLYLDGNEVAFGATPDGRWATGKYAGRVFMAVNIGGDNQTAQPDCVSQIPSIWTTDHRQRGNAHVYLILQFDDSTFPEGLPEIEFLVNGKKCYDPRTATTAWTQNAALIINDYLTNTRYGCGLTNVSGASVIAAANICDNLIPRVGYLAEHRYEFNGVFDPTEGADSVLEDMKSAMGGEICERDGMIHIKPAIWETPSGTFTMDDVRGSIKITTHISKSERFNFARGTFMGADFQETDIPPVKNSTYISEDGGENYQDFAFNFVQSITQAQRLLKIELEKIRQGITVSIQLKLSGLLVNAGDNVYLTLPKYGWSSKPFLVVQAEIVIEDEAVIGVDLELRETAEAIFDWDISKEATIDLAPNTTLPSPFDVPAPTGVVVTSGTNELYIRGDGTVQTRMKVSWVPTTNQFVVGGGYYQIRYKRTIDSAWIATEEELSSASFHFVLDVKDTYVYNVDVRAINSIGVASAWTSATNHTVVGKTQLPSNVTGFGITRTDFGLIFAWADISDADRSEYEIRVGASWGSSTLIWRGKGTSTRIEFKAAGTYNFMIKAIDTSGLYSTTATASSLTIVAPSVVTLSQALNGGELILSWTASTGDFAIKEYEIRYGASFALGTAIGISKTNNHTLRVNWGGARTFWVVARDVADNTSNAATIVVTILNPNPATTFLTSTIRNNVLLDWEAPVVTSLPIARYQVYKGYLFIDAEYLGFVDATFQQYLELSTGEFYYQIVAEDTAGNQSTPILSPLTKIIAPNDFFVLTEDTLAPYIKDPLDDYPYENLPAFAQTTMWLDGNRLVQTVGGYVSQIGDTTPNLNNATQTTPANRPLLTGLSGNKENRLKYSEDFSQSEWVKDRSVLYANNILAPDGSYTAAHVRDNAVAATHNVYQVCSGASASGRASVYLKAAEFTKAWLSIGNTEGPIRGYINVDLITGAIDSVGGDGFDATSENVGDGWFRFGISGNMVEGDLGRSLFIYLDNGTGLSYGSGTGNDGIYVWGGQIQDISTDTTYLKTEAVPKIARINHNKGLYFDGVNDCLTTSIAVNPTGGMWGAVVVKVSKTSSNQMPMSAYPSDQSATRRFYIALDHAGLAGRIGIDMFDGVGGSIGRYTASSAFAVGETFVLSFVYDGTNSPAGIKIFKNGVRIDTTSDSTGTYVVPTAGANLEIGSARLGTSSFINGYIYQAIFGQGSVQSSEQTAAVSASLISKYINADYFPTSVNYITGIAGEPPSRVYFPVQAGALVSSGWPVLTQKRDALETWEERADKKGWTKIQDAIDAGYTSVLTPSNTRAGEIVYEVDHGALLNQALISLEYTLSQTGVSQVSVTPTIEISADGITWITYAGYSEVFASSSFRYSRYIFNFQASDDYGAAFIDNVRFSVEVPKDEDNITITANAGDVGGTLVNFNLSFIDVIDIQVSVNSITPCYVVYDYDFASLPQNQFCYVYAFDKDGARITKEVTVRVRGAIEIL